MIPLQEQWRAAFEAKGWSKIECRTGFGDAGLSQERIHGHEEAASVSVFV